MGVIVIVGVVSVAGLTVTVTADAVIVTVAGGVYLCTDRSSFVVDEDLVVKDSGEILASFGAGDDEMLSCEVTVTVDPGTTRVNSSVFVDLMVMVSSLVVAFSVSGLRVTVAVVPGTVTVSSVVRVA